MQSDTCANELFAFGDLVACSLETDVSRLFIDLDRPFTSIPPERDGVIKKTTLNGKPVFREDHFPDNIAISNMLRRYWVTFQDATGKIIDTGGVKLILDCHTMMAVGPEISPDPGKPRPIIRLEHNIEHNGETISTCGDGLAAMFMEQLSKSLSGEDETVADKFVTSEEPSKGYILNTYGAGKVPMIRLSLSRSLFLNDAYFNFDYLRVDELRIRHLRGLLWEAIEKFFIRNI
jgi:N-formylglutamate deformylase